MDTGVYRISDIFDCKEYIGSAAHGFKKRWNQHLHDLRANRHHSHLLQTAWNTYGTHFFTFDILEECPPKKCIEREQWWMDEMKPEYNISRIAGSPFSGRKHTLETRIKMSNAQLGNKNALGHKHTPETVAKMSAARTGKRLLLQRAQKLAP